MKLYYHKTDGGAEYLTDRYIKCPDGSKEGVFKNATIIVRLDGRKPEALLSGIYAADLLDACKGQHPEWVLMMRAAIAKAESKT